MNEIFDQATSILDKTKQKNRHSLFQLRYFILETEPTIQAKMMKCIEEIKSRHSTLMNLKWGIEEQQDNIRLSELELQQNKNNKSVDSIQDEINKIINNKTKRKIEKLKDDLKNLYNTKLSCEEELSFFVSAFNKMNEKHDLRDLDDFDSNLELWDNKYKEDLSLSFLVNKPISNEVIHCILALPDKSKTKKELNSLIKAKSLDNDIESAKKIENGEESCQIKSHQQIKITQ